MAKHTRLSKSAITSLKDALVRRKYPAPSKVARLVLEAIIFDDGRLSGETFYSQEAGPKGSFTQIRSRLEKDGFIHVILPSGKIVPTLRLQKALTVAQEHVAVTVGYVEKRISERISGKADRSELAVKANRSELEETKIKLEETSKKLDENIRFVAEIAEAVKELKAGREPPDSPEKKNKRDRAAKRLEELALN